MQTQTNFRYFLSYLLGFLLLVSVHASLLTIYQFSFKTVITDSLIHNSFLTIIGYGLYNTFRFYRPTLDKIHYLAGWSFIGTLLVVCLGGLLNWVVLEGDLQYYHFLKNTLFIRALITFFFLCIISIVSWVYYSKKEQLAVEHKKLEVDRLMKEAELAGLRQQMQPHFLFNSLNSINSLIGSNPIEARKMVIQLSDFLRGTLNKDLKQFISLKEELEHLSLYLAIEKVRFGNRLQIHIHQDEALNNFPVPSMILQPVLENAIKYGLYGTIGSISITVKIQSSENQITIIITNPFDADSQTLKGTGFGLSSTHRRLSLLFQRNDLLHVKKTSDSHFITSITIPKVHGNLYHH